jgi:glycosyltransferase involved in cell wall biosynthesis
MLSLIITVLNEKENLPKWLDSILGQSVLPDEIVIVDGGSKDGTWEWLAMIAESNVKIKAFQHPGNISSGRNRAIREAGGDVIIATDAGCIYDKDWFKKITEPFADQACRAVATGFGPWLEKDDGLLLHLIASATTPAPHEFARDWLPSSRSVAFKKSLWQEVGGYPEWIPICEDIIFDLKIRKTGAKFSYIRQPLVFWRPRTSLPAYFKQLYKYTKSDGHGDLWLDRQLIRYAVYSVSIILLLNAVSGRDYAFWMLIIGLSLYINKFWQRWFVFARALPLAKKFSGFLLMPSIIAFGDVAKMCGWPVGVYERLTGKIKFERY